MKINQNLDTNRRDFKRIGGPAIYGLRRWKEGILLPKMISDRAAWKHFNLSSSGNNLIGNGENC